MAQRHQMFDDLPTAIARIRGDAGKSGHFTIEQHDLGPGAYRLHLNLRQQAGGQDDSVDASVAQPLEPGRARTSGPSAMSPTINDAPGGAGLGLHPADQCGVVRVGDAAHHQRQQGVAHRCPYRRYIRAALRHPGPAHASAD